MSNIIYFPNRQQQQPEPQKNKTKEISIEEATHWICKEINPICEGRLTLNKLYKIHYDEIRDEFYMLDDCGCNTVWFLVVEGKCVKLKNKKIR